jgi:hypothetical protein
MCPSTAGSDPSKSATSNVCIASRDCTRAVPLIRAGREKASRHEPGDPAMPRLIPTLTILFWLATPANAYQTYDETASPDDGFSQPPPAQNSSSEPAPAYQAFGEPPLSGSTGSSETFGDVAAYGETFKEHEITQQVEGFFGQGAEQLALAVQKVFKEQGEPNGYIAGEEIGAAFAFGLRYGRGTMTMKYGPERAIFWQGPSIGFDIGANASKVFILVYRLPNQEFIFRRFPGVEGSLYFVGGVGVNYLQSGDVVVAPIRFGAGWRQGISAGYMDFTERAHLNPF